MTETVLNVWNFWYGWCKKIHNEVLIASKSERWKVAKKNVQVV